MSLLKVNFLTKTYIGVTLHSLNSKTVDEVI